MNSDIELLELAAKAAGYELQETEDGYEIDFDDSRIWNPLTDDGDALRLAMKLGLMLDEIQQGYMAGHWVAAHSDIESCYEPVLPDRPAAARRAIVRAAAAIGKAMP